MLMLRGSSWKIPGVSKVVLVARHMVSTWRQVRCNEAATGISSFRKHFSVSGLCIFPAEGFGISGRCGGGPVVVSSHQISSDQDVEETPDSNSPDDPD